MGWKTLPVDIFRLILQYLRIKEIVTLDNSLLNNELREIYLQAVNGVNLGKITSIAGKSSKISWILKRQILFMDLVLWKYLKVHELAPEIPLLDGFTRHFPALISCTIMNLSNLTTDQLTPFLSLNPQLESLKLNYLKNLTPDIIPVVSRSCPNLTALDFSNSEWMTDNAVTLFSNHTLLNLHTLTLNSCRKLRHENSIIHLLALPNLKALWIDTWTFGIDGQMEYFNQFIVPALRSDDLKRNIFGVIAFLPLVEVLTHQISFMCLGERGGPIY